MRTAAERALIAAVLNGANPDDASRITSASFYDPRDGMVWQAMIELHRNGIRPDPASITSHIGRAADADYIRALVDRDANPHNIDHHARQVATTASRRALIDIAYQIQSAADSDQAYGDVIEKARAALDKAVVARQDSQTLAEIYPHMVKSMRSGEQTGLSTPWPDLDHHIVGLQPGRIYTIAARPGVGKSIMAQNIAEHMARVHKRRVYFSTLEMQPVELGLRFLSQAASIDSKKLQTGRLSDEEWAKVEAAGKRGFVDLPIDICATSTQTIESIRSGARDTSRKGQLGLIVIDYLQLMEGADTRGKSRAEIVAGFTRGIKNMAAEFQVPILMLSQLNRAANGAAPDLSNLRESGTIEQDSDIVILLHEDDDKNPGHVTVDVKKSRNGTKGWFDLAKYGRYSRLATPTRSTDPYQSGWSA